MRFHLFTLCLFLLLSLFLRGSRAAPSSSIRRAVAVSTPSTIDELTALKSIDEEKDVDAFESMLDIDEAELSPYNSMSDALYYFSNTDANADVDAFGVPMIDAEDDNSFGIEAVDDDNEDDFSIAQGRRGGVGRGFGRGVGRGFRGGFRRGARRGFRRGIRRGGRRFGRRFGRGFGRGFGTGFTRGFGRGFGRGFTGGFGRGFTGGFGRGFGRGFGTGFNRGRYGFGRIGSGFGFGGRGFGGFNRFGMGRGSGFGLSALSATTPTMTSMAMIDQPSFDTFGSLIDLSME